MRIFILSERGLAAVPVRHTSFLCEGRAVQTLPFNRCCEIMRDLSQADRYFQLFRAFMLSRSALQTAAVLTCCSDAAVSLFLLL